MRDRAELVERSFAHILDRGGMRRTWLRGRQNVHKRYLIHVAGHNLGLLMRLLIGAGTPKEAVARGWCFLVLLPTTDGAANAAILTVLVENSAVPALIVFRMAFDPPPGRNNHFVNGLLWLPYRAGAKARTREVNIDAPGWAVVGYSRAQAVAEKAVLPITFGALDGEASWLEGGKTAADPPRVGPHRLSGPYPTETTRPALFTALRTGCALELLQGAFKATRELRAQRRAERDLGPGESARGLGKLLVVAPDQKSARLYLDWLRGWMPPAQAEREVHLATSDERNAHESLAAFRLTAEPSILVTVAMAYEG